MSLLACAMAVGFWVRRLAHASRIAHATWRRPGLRPGIYETGSHP